MVTQPIRSYKDVQKFKNYYLERGEYRNYLLVSVCLNSALRICDVLKLKWEDIYDFKAACLKTHIALNEQKTGKHTRILINSALKSAVKLYISKSKTEIKKGYIFANKHSAPITRIQAYRIIKEGGEGVGLDISCHSLRKTFGYHAWKKGVPPVMLMKIYNHSSFEVTKCYLGIEQEDKDEVYESVGL